MTFDDAALEKAAADLPADLVQALRTHGLAKVASALTGVTPDEYSTYAKIGSDLFRRRADKAQILRGLTALRDLGV